MPLTDAACRAAKAKDKLYKLSDGGGLQLWVNVSGSRAWRLAYRFEDKQRTLTIGTYPDMKLTEARDVRDDMKRRLRRGEDPATDAVDDASVVHSFEEVALEWHENSKGAWKASHTFRVMRRLEVDVFPAIGDRDVSSIEAPDILKLLRQVEARGALDMAKRVKQTISSVLLFAIATGRAKHDTTADLRGAMRAPPKVKHRNFVRERDLPALLQAIDGYTGDAVTRLALKFTMQTMVRTNETRFARWDEFEGLRSSSPSWRIPADRMKMGAEHLVPLSRQTVDLLREVRALNPHSPHLFPSGLTKTGFLSENTMLYALYRLGYHSRQTVHGFRSSASTILNESGLFNSDWIERQLSHVEKDEVRGAYNAAEWLTQRRAMMQWWADYLDQAAAPKTADALFEDLLG